MIPCTIGVFKNFLSFWERKKTIERFHKLLIINVQMHKEFFPVGDALHLAIINSGMFSNSWISFSPAGNDSNKAGNGSTNNNWNICKCLLLLYYSTLYKAVNPIKALNHAERTRENSSRNLGSTCNPYILVLYYSPVSPYTKKPLQALLRKQFYRSKSVAPISIFMPRSKLIQ